MKLLLSFFIMFIPLPSYGEMSNNEKTAWTGGYIYGFAATICEAKSLGYINDWEFNELSKSIVNLYQDNMESDAYSEESTPYLYALKDRNKLDQVCKNMESFN